MRSSIPAALGTLQFFFLLIGGGLYLAGVSVPWYVLLFPLWGLVSLAIVFWILLSMVRSIFSSLRCKRKDACGTFGSPGTDTLCRGPWDARCVERGTTQPINNLTRLNDKNGHPKEHPFCDHSLSRFASQSLYFLHAVSQSFAACVPSW